MQTRRPMFRPKLILATMTLLALAGARSATAQQSDDADLGQLLEILEQQTTLATNSRLNADFVPGMVSVLSARDLERRGLRNVWQALDLIPGVHTYLDATGMRTITVRGIGDLFEPGKVKLLLNGVPVNASASATTGTIFDTPVEQVERIELVRGPGSAVHGEFAYAGVLNVITRKNATQYAAGLDSGGASAAALFDFTPGSGDFNASLNLAVRASDGDDIDSGQDRAGALPSNAPGRINNRREFVSAILDVEASDWHGIVQFQRLGRGDHFGSNDLLPPIASDEIIVHETFSTVITRNFELAGGIDGALTLGALYNRSDKDDLFLGPPEAFFGLPGDADVFVDSLLEERRLDARISLQAVRGAHTLYGELSGALVKVLDSEQSGNLDPNNPDIISPTINDLPTPVDEGDERGSVSLVLQDEFHIDAMTTLTSGIRLDDYERIGEHLSPRVALVYRHDDNHVFKAQLARAFRPPSLLEEAGAIGNIDPEINDTLEFGHVFARGDRVLRNTIYYTRLDDLIWFQDSAPFGYRNVGSQRLAGYEFELEQRLGPYWDLQASLSLQDYADEGLPGEAPWMLKLSIDHALAPLTDLHLQLNSVAERDRAEGDARDAFDQTTRIDIALRRRNLAGIGGLDLRAGISNLLDERLEYPSPANTYPRDYPYSDGAALWLQLVYRP